MLWLMLGRCADLSAAGEQSKNISTYTLDVYILWVYIICIKQGDRDMKARYSANVYEEATLTWVYIRCNGWPCWKKAYTGQNGESVINMIYNEYETLQNYIKEMLKDETGTISY